MCQSLTSQIKNVSLQGSFCGGPQRPSSGRYWHVCPLRPCGASSAGRLMGLLGMRLELFRAVLWGISASFVLLGCVALWGVVSPRALMSSWCKWNPTTCMVTRQPPGDPPWQLNVDDSILKVFRNKSMLQPPTIKQRGVPLEGLSWPVELVAATLCIWFHFCWVMIFLGVYCISSNIQTDLLVWECCPVVSSTSAFSIFTAGA